MPGGGGVVDAEGIGDDGGGDLSDELAEGGYAALAEREAEDA